MTREEWGIVWHDWLRGVSLIVLCALLAVVYFLRLFSEPVFGLLLCVVAVLVTAVLAVLNCMSSSSVLPVRLSGAAVILAGGVLLVVAGAQVLFPGQPTVEAQLSFLQPQARLAIPESAGQGCYLTVRGRPGASPSGQDSEVHATVRLSTAAGADSFSVNLFRSRPGSSRGGGSSRGPSISAREADMWFLGALPAGEGGLELASLRPEDALPLTVGLHVPLLPPQTLAWALWALVLASLILAIPMLRQGRFPAAVPYCLALAVANQLIARGLPPDRPVLPLVGILLGGIFGGALAGYGATKVIEKWAAAPAPRPKR